MNPEVNPMDQKLKRKQMLQSITQDKPYKTKIKLKKTQRPIPAIQIQLDQMLSQVYTQINQQPTKHESIGQQDVTILPNSLIRQYISSVYQEYSIPDPIKSNNSIYKSYSSSHYNDLRRKLFQTPKKNFKSIKGTETQSKGRSKTIEKLLNMKKKFRQEMDQQDTNKINKENHVAMHSSKQQRKFPLKQSHKSAKQLEEKINGINFLQKMKYKNRYCLVCQSPIMDTIIDQHEKSCLPLQQLLKDKSLTIQRVIALLDGKIRKLNEQIGDQSGNLFDGISQLQKKLKALTSRDSEENLQNLFLELKVIKCWEKVDKLQWFKKMRRNAQNKLKSQ